MNILILDSRLSQVSLLSGFVSLRWNRQFSAQGGFEITANMNTLNAGELRVGRIIYLDPERAGIIESVEITRETNQSGELVTATGIELKDLIKRRITVPPAGFENEEYLGQGTEAIIRGLLSNHVVDPTDPLRKIDLFMLGPVNGVGGLRDFSTRYKPLEDEIYGLLQESQLGLVCTVDLEARKAVLEVKRGRDRTIGQTQNPAAVFSLKLGTASRTVVLRDRQAMRNMAYVGGEGEGAERVILALPESPAAGIERREFFVDASDAATPEELAARGSTKLAEMGQCYTVEGAASNALLEYALGDIVSVADHTTGDYENMQITGITDTYAGTAAPQRSIVFGRPAMDIAQAVKFRMSGINNLLTR